MQVFEISFKIDRVLIFKNLKSLFFLFFSTVAISISRATANRQIKEHLETGLIKKIGKGPASRYTRSD